MEPREILSIIVNNSRKTHCMFLDISSSLNEFVFKPFLSTLAGVIIGYLINYFKEKIPAKIKWNLSDATKAKFVIATSAKIDTGKYIRLATGMGQVLAIGKLLTSFVKAYSKKCDPHILFSDNFSDTDLRNDLIIIGGTKNNKIADILLKKCPHLPYTQKVIDDVDVIIDNRRHQNIYGGIHQGTVSEDFGLIISIPNPFNIKSRAILFLSVHTYGLEAAAEAFIHNISFWKSLRNKNYICLIKCNIKDLNVGTPEILDFVKIKHFNNGNN